MLTTTDCLLHFRRLHHALCRRKLQRYQLNINTWHYSFMLQLLETENTRKYPSWSKKQYLKMLEIYSLTEEFVHTLDAAPREEVRKLKGATL